MTYTLVPVRTITRLSIAIWAATLVGLGAISGIGCTSQRRPQPQNRTVILIDTSDTYRLRLMDSVTKAAGLLEQFASTKVRRWEHDGDYIAILTIDAMPDVIWEGTLHELQTLDNGTFRERLAARKDYAGCTDVAAAFAKAAARLSGDPRVVHKYLFVFSDLIDEPPTSSAAKCKPPKRPSVPPDAMPWEAIREMSVTAFWLPVNQKLAWSRAIANAGLTESFRLYSESESASVEIPAPPRPTRVVTEAERQATQVAVIRWGRTMFRWVGFAATGVICLVLLAVGLAVVRRRGGHPLDRRSRIRRPERSEIRRSAEGRAAVRVARAAPRREDR